ncbi:MAG: HEAT repeat domain-containing protein [Deltaproteobacteria bacterium]|nr:HEAT repeat domain-containing protein [Deltaproteobacteria bacterium]
MRKPISFLALLVLLLMPLGATAQLAGADPLDRLDPERHGAGTLIAALEALDAYRPSQAEAPARELLSHAEPEVARTAGWFLRRMGRAGHGADTVAAVLADENADAAMRFSAVSALGPLRYGSSIARQVLTESEDPALRKAAAKSLGEIHGTGSVDALQAAINSDADLPVQRAAAWAIIRQRDVTADALVTLTGHGEAEVRLQVVWALAQPRFVAASGITGHLRRILQGDADCRVQAAAAWALGEMADSLSAEALQQAVDSSRCRMASQAAVAALSRL